MENLVSCFRTVRKRRVSITMATIQLPFEELYPPKYDDFKKSEVPHLQSRTYEYVTCEEAHKNLELSSEKHLNEKKFLDFNDHRTLEFDDEFTGALQPFFPLESVKYRRFRGRKNPSFAAWLILKDGVEEPFIINSSFLEKDFEPRVTAVTLLNSDEVRLMRISLKENGSRLYEIINGSCKMQFNWLAGGEIRFFAAVLHSDGSVDADAERSLCDFESLAENKDAFVRFGNSSNPELSLIDVFNKYHG